MKPEIIEAMGIIRKACAAVVTDLPNHQAIQAAIDLIEGEIRELNTEKVAKTAVKNGKLVDAAKK